MTTDYTRLRALAEAATPGPWMSAITRQFAWVETVPEFDLHRFDIQAETIANIELKDEDATYIAAANPQTMIALLDRLEELEGREPEWEYECRPHPAYDWRPCGMPEGCASERRRRRSAGPWEPVTGDDDA